MSKFHCCSARGIQLIAMCSVCVTTLLLVVTLTIETWFTRLNTILYRKYPPTDDQLSSVRGGMSHLCDDYNYRNNVSLKRCILQICENTFDYTKYRLVTSDGAYLYQRKANISIQLNNNYNNLIKYSKTKTNSPKYNYIRKINNNKLNIPSSMYAMRMGNTFFYDINRHWLYCSIQKTGSTQTNQLLYYYATNKTKRAIHSIVKHSNHKLENNVSSFYQIKKRQTFESLIFSNDINIDYHTQKKILKFLLIRDPLKRFLSGFQDKCLSKDFLFECKFIKPKSNDKYNDNQGSQLNDVQLFDKFVNIMYYNRYYAYQQAEWNNHFLPQSYRCHLFDFIEYYDIIIPYDKIHYKSNLIYLFKQILMLNENFNNRKNRDKITTKYIVSNYFEKMDFKYAKNAVAKSQQQEWEALQKFYTRSNGLKVAEMFTLDYQWLPLEAPIWILDLSVSRMDT